MLLGLIKNKKGTEMVVALSYSAIEKYRTCPRQFEAVRITKEVKEEMHPSAIFGSEVHKTIEDFIMEGKEFPSEHEMYKSLVDQVMGIVKPNYIVTAEAKYYLDKDLNPLVTDDFFDSNIGFRAIVDLLVFNEDYTKCAIIDWKTGKDKNTDQLKVSAWVLAKHFPQLEEFVTGFVFLKSGTIINDKFTRSSIKDYKPEFDKIQRSIEDRVFECKPSGLCKGWCPVTTCHNWTKKSSYKK